MSIKRNQRVGIDDRWQKRVKNEDGTMSTVRSSLWGSSVARWRVRWVDDAGKEHSKSFKRKPDAQNYVDTLTADVVRGDYIDPGKGKILFGTVAEQWFTTKAIRKAKTVAGYRSLLETLVLPRWESVPIKDIDYQAYSAWLASLSSEGGRSGKGLSASRVIQAHQLVGAVLKYAQKSGLVAKNVAASIEPHDLPNHERREPLFLTAAQLHGLAGKCGRFEVFTLLLGYTGLRFGEGVALRRGHVGNLGDRQLTISESVTDVRKMGRVLGSTKTSQVRRVSVPQPIWERMTLPPYSWDLLFPGKDGHLKYGEYRWVFDKAVTAMREETTAQREKEIAATGQASTPEFPPVTPHDLRHTAASLAISVGANIKVVQNMLGHATAAMTLDRYGHLLHDDQAGVATALGELLTSTAATLRPQNGDENAKAS